MKRCRMLWLTAVAALLFVQGAAIETGLSAQSTDRAGLDAMRDSLFDVQPAQDRIAALRKISTFYLSTVGDSEGADRLVGGLAQTFGWSMTEELADADVILFFQSKTFLDDSLRSMRGNEIPTTDLGMYRGIGPMPQQVHRKTLALLTNQKAPRLLYMYEVDSRQGVWHPQDALRHLKEFMGSPSGQD